MKKTQFGKILSTLIVFGLLFSNVQISVTAQ